MLNFILAEEERGELHFFDELLSIMERLRGPGGCPWDKEQKLSDLRPYIVEEAYELADAISEGGADNIREESGDLLLQIVFIASITKEAGLFGIEDVVRTLCDKLVRRHPHVFANAQVANSTEVIRNWEQIKREERKDKKEDPSVLAGVPKGLPPLLKAHRVQGKAAHVGFDWPRGNLLPLFDKLAEETKELRQAVASGSAKAVEEKLGDLLFMVVNLARHLDVNPDSALFRACAKFATRFRQMEEDAAARGLRLNECSPEELDTLWNRAKERT
ncbi:MAG: nucleoside triphosphate pyrophosphohydrolase [Synergistaceae bacterium]|nr:nucleoside triphosphate pyrophosphohydrolase [Synergistaceae bacterium]